MISDGNGGNNYSTNLINDRTGVINKASLTITANNNSRIYGDANPAFTGSISGFVNGETLEKKALPVALIIRDFQPPRLPMWVRDTKHCYRGNYSKTPLVNGTLTINKAALPVITNDKLEVPAIRSSPLTATYSGFKLGQNECLAAIYRSRQHQYNHGRWGLSDYPIGCSIKKLSDNFCKW